MDAASWIALAGLGLNVLQWIVASIRSLHKIKTRNILYINANKKTITESQLKSVISQYDDFSQVFAISNKPTNFRKYKLHFLKQRYSLFRILRNMQKIETISYSGMVSTPLSVFDGYILGDTHAYDFYDMNSQNNNLYKISYQKNRQKGKYPFSIPEGTKEVCLVIDTSYRVSKEAIKDCPSSFYGERLSKEQTTGKTESGELSVEDLQDIYNYVSDFMEACSLAKVGRVHLYLSCKQPIAFIVGTAIQPGSPKTIVYEWFEGRYQWALCLQEAKLMEEYKNE